MEIRQKELSDLQSYIGKIDAEVMMVLQHIQWDRSNLLQEQPVVNCKYNSAHRIPMNHKDTHEEQCFLKSNGYSKDDKFLSDPDEVNYGTLIKFGKNEIKQIIDTAAKADPSFKRGTGNECVEPLTLERLQATYTGDERRALYDAVVKAAPSCHDLADLALLSENGEEQKNQKQKSRMEILAELRDMKRRRTKYRVAAKTRNYSDLLRDVIKTQMELYTDVKAQVHQTKIDNSDSKSKDRSSHRESHRSTRDEYISTGNNRQRNVENYSKQKRDRSKDRSFQHYTDKRNVKNFEDKQYRKNRNESIDYNDKHQRLNIKEEGYKKDKDKYSSKDFDNIDPRSHWGSDNLRKEKNDKYHRDFSSSKHKRKYRDEDLDSDRIYIKQEDDFGTTSEKSHYYESKYKDFKSINDSKHRRGDASRFYEQNSSPKSQHDNSRKVDTKYDRYHNNHCRKDRKSHVRHSK